MANSSHRSSVSTLDDTHSSIFRRAIVNVLAADIAFETYAQIIDGIPVADVAWDLNPRSRRLYDAHPVNGHTELCSAALDKTVKFRNEFDPSTLELKPETLAAFQAAPESSRSFNLRLIELIADALHQIAVTLHQKREHCHNPETTAGLDAEAVTHWKRPQIEGSNPPLPPYPTLFIHGGFTAAKYYPNGVADMVGFWTEDRILGGVSLFDRTRNWGGDNGDQEPNIWYQCARTKVTYRVCQLLDEQQDQLVRFLLGERGSSESGQCPLPILPTIENRTRMESWDAIPLHKVYRHLWERTTTEPLTTWQRRRRRHCCKSRLDYPELADWD